MTQHNALPATPAWQALANHASQHQQSIAALFEQDPQRQAGFSASTEHLFLDYSKNAITDEIRRLLIALADEAGLPEAIEAMFSGQTINSTEQRAVLHTALRVSGDEPVLVDGRNVIPDVHAVRQQMAGFCQRVWSGDWHGYTEQSVRHIVNIGIGGSHLGPMMACRALQAFADPDTSIDFVSNVDAADMKAVLARLDLSRTLFIIASKTFTTQETMANARLARQAMLDHGCPETDIGRHFVAVTTNRDAAVAFGIDADNLFAFWDWVGGRYSMWSSIGLGIALYLGMDNFEAMLKGAEAMDQHFRTTGFASNLPVLMALTGIWNSNLLGMHQHVVACYDQRLALFPEHLQQLDMESNGKQTRLDGEPCDYRTGPMIIGGTGTNAQHAYFQLLHQGTEPASMDFIACLQDEHGEPEHHAMLLANCFAQSEALMNGRDAAATRDEMLAAGIAEDEVERLVNHRRFPGNRPSNTLLFKRLTPESLGALVALYEHKVFVQGVIWQINSFDQWGVELGKQLTGVILKELQGDNSLATHDDSTRGLIDLYRRGDWKG